jgi:cytochrome c oxidase cbb3-type subunit 3
LGGRLLLPALLLAALSACSPDPGPIREWTPKDHDREDPVKNQMGQVRQAKQTDDEPELVELAWEKNCVRCHGRFGQGDGPMGPANHAPDLTRPDFLSSHSNEEIEATIRNGRDKMPAFGTLPDRVITGLVKRIRAQGRPD